VLLHDEEDDDNYDYEDEDDDVEEGVKFHSSPKWSREDNEGKEGQLLKHEDKQTGSTTAKFPHLNLI